MRKHPIAEFMDAEGIQTQAEAARRLGLRDQQEVSDYITWRHVPRLRKMRALAQRLNCPVSMFIPDADPITVPGVEVRPKTDRRSGADRRGEGVA